jgi:hypothetical protein
MDEAAIRDFWNGVAAKRGGVASLASYCTYLGRSGEKAEGEPSGLIYLAAGKLWFETVESPPTLFGFPMPQALAGDAYQPMEICLALGGIKGAVLVGYRDAMGAIASEGPWLPLKPLGLLGGFFGRTVLQILPKEGPSEFFEAVRARELAAALGRPPTD